MKENYIAVMETEEIRITTIRTVDTKSVQFEVLYPDRYE